MPDPMNPYGQPYGQPQYPPYPQYPAQQGSSFKDTLNRTIFSMGNFPVTIVSLLGMLASLAAFVGVFLPSFTYVEDGKRHIDNLEQYAEGNIILLIVVIAAGAFLLRNFVYSIAAAVLAVVGEVVLYTALNGDNVKTARSYGFLQLGAGIYVVMVALAVVVVVALVQTYAVHGTPQAMGRPGAQPYPGAAPGYPAAPAAAQGYGQPAQGYGQPQAAAPYGQQPYQPAAYPQQTQGYASPQYQQGPYPPQA